MGGPCADVGDGDDEISGGEGGAVALEDGGGAFDAGGGGEVGFDAVGAFDEIEVCGVDG